MGVNFCRRLYRRNTLCVVLWEIMVDFTWTDGKIRRLFSKRFHIISHNRMISLIFEMSRLHGLARKVKEKENIENTFNSSPKVPRIYILSTGFANTRILFLRAVYNSLITQRTILTHSLRPRCRRCCKRKCTQSWIAPAATNEAYSRQAGRGSIELDEFDLAGLGQPAGCWCRIKWIVEMDYLGRPMCASSTVAARRTANMINALTLYRAPPRILIIIANPLTDGVIISSESSLL